MLEIGVVYKKYEGIDRDKKKKGNVIVCLYIIRNGFVKRRRIIMWEREEKYLLSRWERVGFRVYFEELILGKEYG